ncbi:MAG: alpha/beta fold hydrolase, partial [Silvanigrellaceae bacterium]
SGVQFLTRNDARIAVDYEGPRDGLKPNCLLVLINGFARPRADFRAFRRRIHAQMDSLATVALDNRGAGETEGGLATLSVREMALDASFVAQSFAAKLSLDHYSVLGISMGGMIAQTLAAQDALVESLVLVSTTAGGAARIWPQGVDPEIARQKPFEPWPQDVELMMKRMLRYFGPKFRKASPLLIETMVKNMLKSHAVASEQGRARAQYNATVGFDGTAIARKINCPTLVLTGDEDEIIPPQNSQEICNLIPHSRLESFAGMGHLLLIEDPENFVARVRSFLDSLQS